MTEAERERTTAQRQVEDLNRQRESITSYLDELRHLLGNDPVPSLSTLERAEKAEAEFAASRTAPARTKATARPQAQGAPTAPGVARPKGRPAPVSAAAAQAQSVDEAPAGADVATDEAVEPPSGEARPRDEGPAAIADGRVPAGDGGSGTASSDAGLSPADHDVATSRAVDPATTDATDATDAAEPVGDASPATATPANEQV